MQIRRNFPDISYLSETQKNNFQFLNEWLHMKTTKNVSDKWKLQGGGGGVQIIAIGKILNSELRKVNLPFVSNVQTAL